MNKPKKSLILSKILSKSLVKPTYTIKNIRKLKQHLRNHIISKFSQTEFHQIWKIISNRLPKEWYSQKIKVQDIIEYVVSTWTADLKSENALKHEVITLYRFLHEEQETVFWLSFLIWISLLH